MKILTGVLLIVFLVLILPVHAETSQNNTKNNQDLQNKLQEIESNLTIQQNNLNNKFDRAFTEITTNIDQIGTKINESENQLHVINKTLTISAEKAEIETFWDRITNYVLAGVGIILAGVGIGYALYSTRELRRFINWGRYVQHATTYFNARDWQNAKIYYDKALELTPKHVDLLNNAGASSSRLKNDKEALPYYEKILEVEPHSAIALNNKGAVLIALKQYPEAEEVFIDALEANSESIDTLNNMGLLYQNNLEYDYALSYFDRILEIRPNDITAWFNKGQVMSEQKQWETAVSFYNNALSSDPNFKNASPPDLGYSQILQQKGNALTELKRFDEAVACYKKALMLSPLDSDNTVNLASALGELKKFDEVIPYLDQYLVTNPYKADVLRSKGDCLESTGKSKEAVECYNRALDLDPLSSITLNNKGKSLMSLGKDVQALLCFKESIRIKSNVNALFNLGIVLIKHRNRDESNEYFRQVVDISDMQNYEDSFHRCLALAYLSEFNLAIESLQDLARINPSDVRVQHSLANDLLRSNRYGEAIDIYNKILQTNPKDIESLAGKGLSLNRMGMYERSIETCLDPLLLIQSLNPVGLHNKGVALLKLGKPNQALDFFERALEVEPQNIAILFDKGSCLLELGKYQNALNEFHRILEIDNTDGAAMFGMSLVFAELGDYVNAWIWWDRQLEAKGINRDFLDLMLHNLRTRGINSVQIIDLGGGYNIMQIRTGRFFNVR